MEGPQASSLPRTLPACKPPCRRRGGAPIWPAILHALRSITQRPLQGPTAALPPTPKRVGRSPGTQPTHGKRLRPLPPPLTTSSTTLPLCRMLQNDALDAAKADAALPGRHLTRVGRVLLGARPHPSTGWVRPSQAGAEDLPGRRARSLGRYCVGPSYHCCPAFTALTACRSPLTTAGSGDGTATAHVLVRRMQVSEAAGDDIWRAPVARRALDAGQVGAVASIRRS